jgi:hypothetical protein
VILINLIADFKKIVPKKKKKKEAPYVKMNDIFGQGHEVVNQQEKIPIDTNTDSDTL